MVKDIFLYYDNFMLKSNKKSKTNNKGQVIVPTNLPTPPEPHELSAAYILAKHFQCTVEFLTPIDDYKRKTPDFKMLDVYWELKSPISSSKTAISNAFRKAAQQSRNIVIDFRRTKFDKLKAVNIVQYELKNRKSVKKVLIVIEKIVIEIYR